MTATLPPLRLTGATVLREGRMSARTVAIAGGRIAAGPFPAVDLSGYVILPGIIDLCGEALTPGPDAGHALDEAAARAARAGVTTTWMRHDWTLASGPDGPDTTESLLAANAALRPAIDLRVHLRVERLATLDAEGLLGVIRRHGVDLVSFRDGLTRRLAQAETAPEDFTLWARMRGQDPARLLERLRAAHERRQEVPRKLCRLAEAFDRLGVSYGSAGDPDGEARETYAMLGAKLCLAPQSASAAAVAQAVGDPVILRAADALADTARPGPARALMRAGRCQALCSHDQGRSALRAATALTRDRMADLPALWQLVSEAPAAIMGLPDRGIIAQGKRADLIVLNPVSGRIEATLSKGRVAHLSGQAAARFVTAGLPLDVAAA